MGIFHEERSVSTAHNNYRVKFGVGKAPFLALLCAIPARRCCAGGALAAGGIPQSAARPGPAVFGMRDTARGCRRARELGTGVGSAPLTRGRENHRSGALRLGAGWSCPPRQPRFTGIPGNSAAAPCCNSGSGKLRSEPLANATQPERNRAGHSFTRSAPPQPHGG